MDILKPFVLSDYTIYNCFHISSVKFIDICLGIAEIYFRIVFQFCVQLTGIIRKKSKGVFIVKKFNQYNFVNLRLQINLNLEFVFASLLNIIKSCNLCDLLNKLIRQSTSASPSWFVCIFGNKLSTWNFLFNFYDLQTQVWSGWWPNTLDKGNS